MREEGRKIRRHVEGNPTTSSLTARFFIPLSPVFSLFSCNKDDGRSSYLCVWIFIVNGYRCARHNRERTSDSAQREEQKKNCRQDLRACVRRGSRARQSPSGSINSQ